MHRSFIGHVLVTGKIGSGKSTLVRKYLVPQWRSKGVPVLALDPIGQFAPPVSDWWTPDPYEFLACAKASHRCLLVIDECQETIGKSVKLEQEMAYLATRSRNDGHLAIFIAQRPMMIPPDYRCQCAHVYAFHQKSKRERCTLRDEWGDEAFMLCDQLRPGECLYCRSFAPPVRLTVFK